MDYSGLPIAVGLVERTDGLFDARTSPSDQWHTANTRTSPVDGRESGRRAFARE